MGSIRIVLTLILFFFDRGLPLRSCPGLRQLSNGRLFFRYGGIYVTYFCNPGFQRYGYQTSSCVTGRWTRAPPVCVASGCPEFGTILHGSRTLNKDSSVARFTCDYGFELFGTPTLYCNGKKWNGIMPACKESDLIRTQQKTHFETTRSTFLPNRNRPSSLKKISGNVFKRRFGDTATQTNLIKHEFLPGQEVDAGTRSVPGRENVTLNHLVINKNTHKNSPVREVQEKSNLAGKTPSFTSRERFSNNKSTKERFNRVQIQTNLVAPSSPPSASSPSYLSFPMMPRLPQLLSISGNPPSPLEPTILTPFTSPLTPSSSTSNPLPIPSTTTELLSLSLTPSSGSSKSLRSSLQELSTSILQRNPSTLTELPSSSLPSISPPTSLPRQLSTPFPRDSNPTALPSTQISSSRTFPFLVKEISALHSTRQPHTLTQSVADLALARPHPNGWFRETKKLVAEKHSFTDGDEDIEAVTTKFQGKQLSSKYNPKQLLFSWIFPEMVTINAGHSKPETSVSEVVLTPQVSTGSATNELSPSLSKDRTVKYTFTAENETRNVPSPFYSLMHQYEKEELVPNVNMEISFSSLPIVPFPATELVSPKTRENYEDLKLTNPWFNSITTTMSPNTGTSNSQTYRDITLLDPSARDIAIGTETQSKTDLNRHENTELSIKAWGMSRDHILLPWDTSVQKRNRGTNGQTANSSKGTEIVMERVKMLTTIQSESNPREAQQASNAKAIVQQQDSQIVLRGSDSGSRSNETGDTLSNGDQLNEAISQSNLVEITLKEMETTHIYLEGRNACPSPLIPDNGIFNFRGLVGPSPLQYKYYVQYSCNSGYALTHGDQFSFCQHNGMWSGQVPTCADVNECIIGLNDCQQMCVNTFGSYKCNCQTGFLLTHDGKTCADIDECILPVGIASCLFGCINTAGSFICHCPEGYQLSTTNGHCKDIDECAENNGRGPCAMECQNTLGSFSCSCLYGYKLAGDGQTCIAECPSGYRKENHMERPNWHREIQQCVDINECLDGFSQHRPCEWKCLNLPGSYRCICPRGYKLNEDKHHCEDVNECSYKNGGCSHLCINTNGGYRCECPEGYGFSPYSRKNCQAIGV